MFKKGIVGEVRKLLNRRLSKTAAQILGIRQIRGYLEGKYSVAECRRLLARDTRHFAKRQLTWFRHDKRIRWIGEKEFLRYAIDRFKG